MDNRKKGNWKRICCLDGSCFHTLELIGTTVFYLWFVCVCRRLKLPLAFQRRSGRRIIFLRLIWNLMRVDAKWGRRMWNEKRQWIVFGFVEMPPPPPEVRGTKRRASKTTVLLAKCGEMRVISGNWCSFPMIKQQHPSKKNKPNFMKFCFIIYNCEIWSLRKKGTFYNSNKNEKIQFVPKFNYTYSWDNCIKSNWRLRTSWWRIFGQNVKQIGAMEMELKQIKWKIKIGGTLYKFSE